MRLQRFVLFAAALTLLVPALPAAAQTSQARQVPPAASRFRLDVGLGMDISLSGNINSGAIGVLNDQVAVVVRNRYEDVYGTGVHFRFGGGYALDEMSELRAVFTLQTVDADLTRLGDIGTSRLYGQYDDYKSLTLDVGYRRYVPHTINTTSNIKFYGEGTVGLGFISELDVLLAAPASDQVFDATDFYDGTAAFALGLNAGVLLEVASQVDLNLQIGLRYLTGLSTVDAFRDTGLEDINSGSRRWTLPFVMGASYRF